MLTSIRVSDLTSLGLVLIHQGSHLDICVTPDIRSAFLTAAANERASVLATMQLLADQWPHVTLHTKQYRYEGAFPLGGNPPRDMKIYAFKGIQLRVYGAVLRIGTRDTWVGTALDIKKRNKADQQLLARAAKKLRDYHQ